MSEETLYQFHLSLIPNLVKELFFFIPEKGIRPDIIEKLDVLKKYNFLDTVLFFDEYKGPIHYTKGSSNKYVLLKESDLEKNIFKLLEKKSQGKEHEFNYVLNKYFEFVETMFYMIKWMYNNSTEIIKNDSNLSNIFYIQFTSYKNHFKTLVKTFYDSKETIPRGNFNAHFVIDTHFPDVVKSFKKNNDINILNFEQAFKKLNLDTSKKTAPSPPITINKKDKKSLLTEKEAEKILLQTFFNVGEKD